MQGLGFGVQAAGFDLTIAARLVRTEAVVMN